LAIDCFVNRVLDEGRKYYRNNPWRNTNDPYAIVVSEFMLQQTQATRVSNYYTRWIEQFPTFDALSAASTTDVLTAWQGLGYNRRALLLKRLAQQVSEDHNGILPSAYDALLDLPGIGPATAAAITAFAYDEYAPQPYLETNVRSVVLHEVFPAEHDISDKEIIGVLQQAVAYAQKSGVRARQWSYALLDYGTWLKKTFPNPSRRSKHHSKQSKFEGSFRQKRAQMLRAILSDPNSSTHKLAEICTLEIAETEAVLAALENDGLIQQDGNAHYCIID